MLIEASVLEFALKLPCPKAKRRITEAIRAVAPRMTERKGGVYSSI
jgi:hypothetical protein